MKTIICTLVAVAFACFMNNGIEGVPECPQQEPDANATLLIHEECCDRYYVCANEVPTVMNCGKGTTYNENDKICDWPTNVECGSRTICNVEQES